MPFRDLAIDYQRGRGMLVTVAGALAAPPFTSRIADRYIAPTDEAVQTRVYVLAGGSNMDG